MLSAEAAKAQLEQFLLPDPGDIDELLIARLKNLPKSLLKIGYGFCERNPDGTVIKFQTRDWTNYEKKQQIALEATRPLDSVSDSDRLKFFNALAGPLATAVSDTWDLLKTLPYQRGGERRAFRSPELPAATIDGRIGWLKDFLTCTARVKSEYLTPQWLAAWGSHLDTSWKGKLTQSDLIKLLAASINSGGKTGREVFDILIQSVKNEHPIAGPSHMATGALLTANNPEGWELIQRTLLAAQRQEGLRQAILEAADEAHPQAFRQILRLIRDEKLTRFSAVARAVSVWCGLCYESDQAGSLNIAISRILDFLEQPASRIPALKSEDPEKIYFSLYSIAFDDAHSSIPPARKLLTHATPEIRFAVVHFLSQLTLPESINSLIPCIGDDDLRIAMAALHGTNAVPCGGKLRTDSQRFEQIEKLLQRLPEKKKVSPPILWPWTQTLLDRPVVAAMLHSALEDLPPTRLIPYLKLMHTYSRAAIVEQLARQKKWDRLTRETLLEQTGNTSSDVRTAAIEALTRVELTPREILFIEGLLTRKVSDLRVGALKLLLGQPDPQAHASATRLLQSKDTLARLGGLELLCHMCQAGRTPHLCIEAAHEYRAHTKKLTREEATQLETILAPVGETLTLDNALGLLNPAELTPIPSPRNRGIKFVTDATLEIIQALDDLVHEHRNERMSYWNWENREMEDLLGAAYFPPPPRKHSPELEREKFPLREIWEDWLKTRPKSQRDKDGFELIRAELFLEPYSYAWERLTNWAEEHPDRKSWFQAFTGGKKPIPLKYENTVGRIIDWLNYLHPPQGLEEFLLDAAETWLALAPPTCLEDLVQAAKLAAENPDSPYFSGDWRELLAFRNWMETLKRKDLYARETPAHLKRRWNLARYFDQPIPGASRSRPALKLTFQAFQAGLGSPADLTESLLGPRPHETYGWVFYELYEITNPKPSSEIREILDNSTGMIPIVERCRERILEIELARGDTPTPATPAAHALNCYGTKTLGRILQTIGNNSFKVTRSFDKSHHARIPTFTSLVAKTFPTSQDTQADFDREIKSALQAGLREQTLLELMFLAPQWTRFVENHIRWPGLSEGLCWFLAHMKYINADTEAAANTQGYEADKEADPDEDDTRNRRSAWNRLIAERTTLSETERDNGAIDVPWFHKIYAQLTPQRWEALSAAARYAATPAQARRATYISEVLLGSADSKELFAQVTVKKLKESVRLIGLYPLAKGAKRTADLAERYKMLVDYRRYAKTLNSLTKPSALQALDIGFKNLAGTAGFTDVLRLEWAMEADAVNDLAQGPVSATTDGVTVTLTLDDMARPVLTTLKNDKPLKTIPPAVKKDHKIAPLLERVGELRRQASRIRESLETALCRGDEFTARELVNLSAHAMLGPLLSRLLLTTGDTIGFPAKNGTALSDHAGKTHPLKPDALLRLAHPVDLHRAGDWAKWQHACFHSGIVQPFKQIFRELYLVTKQEQKDATFSRRYAGQQVNPTQANALWNARNWHTTEGVFKPFVDAGITASVDFQHGFGTPLEVEGYTFDTVSFCRRDQIRPMKLADVPPRLFSEVMRDLDLVVSVAHRGGVDSEATASTVEMREALIRETALLLGLKNVHVKQPRVIIKGQLAEYAIHLGSGNVHLMPGGALCLVPVHAQHRGRLFLPFADDDPRTAEIISKTILLAKDREIQDPGILAQLLGK